MTSNIEEQNINYYHKEILSKLKKTYINDEEPRYTKDVYLTRQKYYEKIREINLKEFNKISEDILKDFTLSNSKNTMGLDLLINAKKKLPINIYKYLLHIYITNYLLDQINLILLKIVEYNDPEYNK